MRHKVEEIGRDFNLVMVAERFVESQVLLARWWLVDPSILTRLLSVGPGEVASLTLNSRRADQRQPLSPAASQVGQVA